MKYVSPAKDESWAEQAAGFVNPGGLLVSLHTPGVGEGTAELHVFDSLDRHTGPDGGGGFEEGIPESAFQRDEDGAQHVAIHNDTGERFTIQILAVAAGPVNLAVTEVTGTIPAETARAFHGVALEGGATAQLETGAASDHILRVDNDGDGVFETEEEADTLFIDSDSDGLPDAWEAAFGTEVAVPDASGDPDEDGSTNFDEYREGTDPLDADTDGDGILDDIDLCPGHDDRADSDGDGVADGCDQPPVISNVQVYVPEDGATTATVTWDTDREADSFVRLGTESGSYPDRWEDGTLEMVHQMGLTGLDPGQMYTYRVGGTDIGGNTVESAEYTFTTSYLGPPYAVYLPTVLRNAP
jgi:hypothetical protein